MQFQATAHEVRDAWEWLELAYERGWTDGLPVAPPTEERVGAVLDYLGRDPQDVVGIVPPRQGVATVEAIAINCVMAGCTPQLTPAVLAALEAMLRPEFNLNGVQTTTNACAPLTIAHSTFVAAARAQATCLGLPALPLYLEPAPAGGNRPGLTPAILSSCVSRLLEALTVPSAAATGC